MNILVTGHCGFIGKYLVDRLKKDQHVEGIDRVEGKDLNDITLQFPKVDLVYHLAAQTSVISSLDNPIDDAINNILATIALYKHYKDTKIIYAASGGASQQDEITSPYGLSKLVAGEYLRIFHKNVVICNLPNVFGEGGKGVIEIFLANKELEVYGGEQTRDFVHVEDIVDGLLLAEYWEPGEYFLGSGKEVKIIDLAKATGKSFKIMPAREGELTKVVLPNITPDWRPLIDVFNYLKGKMKCHKRTH